MSSTSKTERETGHRPRRRVSARPDERQQGENEMTEKRTFGEQTIARCNRCNAKGHLDRTVAGVRENGKAWRLEDMAKIVECGHLDSHWVYDQDNKS